jgi:DNA-directed RNA polymerase specialized sigma24 family protein
LKYLSGFSEKEIAEAMRLRQSTVKSRLYVARQRLIAILSRSGEGL